MPAHSNPEHRLMVIAVSRMHPPTNLIPYLEMHRLGSWRVRESPDWRWSRSALEALELRDLNALYLKIEAVIYTNAQRYNSQLSAVA